MNRLPDRAHAELSRLLKEARKTARMTQQQTAAALDRPQSFVSKYEKGERQLNVIEFIEICLVLGCDPRTIVDTLAELRPAKTRGWWAS
ncbi:MAG: helix-turn-helix transcriptional regulator [Burkholderiales bacterium]|nr:helix-turn-helix transcriptional regulator [Burkholderiales bacterium]